MSEKNIHYVVTLEEGRELVKGIEHFWAGDCGCRRKKEKCNRSRIDVCLQFKHYTAAEGFAVREITPQEVEELFREAEEKKLVCRPFRDFETKTVTEGICFCCDDCCSYFSDADEPCDMGTHVTETDFNLCTHCGLCISPCYFKARFIEKDLLKFDQDKCYGCGLCINTCPEDCIKLIERNLPKGE